VIAALGPEAAQVLANRNPEAPLPEQMLQLTPHFSYLEMTATQVRGQDNRPDNVALFNLKRTAQVMEKVRDLFAAPINVHSGYRSPEVNRIVGGVPESAHKYGLACDFDISTWGSNREVWTRLKPKVAEFGIDQLILEFDAWVHIGLAAPGYVAEKPRGMIFTIGCPA
jgi:zinc D-Ala-D-Ala carboxypeptidase